MPAKRISRVSDRVIRETCKRFSNHLSAHLCALQVEQRAVLERVSKITLEKIKIQLILVGSCLSENVVAYSSLMACLEISFPVTNVSCMLQANARGHLKLSKKQPRPDKYGINTE